MGVGISVFSALLTTMTEVNHADISANVTAVNRAASRKLRK
jgi:hypothetical protein